MFGPVDSGGPGSKDNGRSAPTKVIHDPSEYEMREVNAALIKLGISGSMRGVLLMGEKVFDQEWVSTDTKNWLGLFNHDMKLWEECTDPTEQKIHQLKVELDYAALMMLMYQDAVTAKKLEQQQ